MCFPLTFLSQRKAQTSSDPNGWESFLRVEWVPFAHVADFTRGEVLPRVWTTVICPFLLVGSFPSRLKVSIREAFSGVTASP